MFVLIFRLKCYIITKKELLLFVKKISVVRKNNL